MLAVSCRKITLELPEAERIRLTAYLHKVRDKIHREAITRMFRGQNKRIIQTTRQDTKLEFDVQNWRTIFYRNVTELEAKLRASVESAYGDVITTNS